MATSLSRDILKKMNITKAASIEEFVKRERLDKKKVALVPHLLVPRLCLGMPDHEAPPRAIRRRSLHNHRSQGGPWEREA